MEPWRRAWREGFLPSLSRAGLAALRDAIRADDARLVQGCTTAPPPLLQVRDWPVEACDAVCFAGWVGDGLETVGEVEGHFAKCCHEANARLGDPTGCREFLRFWDETPRYELFPLVLAEVDRALSLQPEVV